jgi:hypothetical protein
MALRRAKLELEHAKDTFNGHQQTAIDACERAIQELETVVRKSATPAWLPQFTPPLVMQPTNSACPQKPARSSSFP